MPDTLRIGLLGPLQVRDEAGRTVHVGGRQLRVLLVLLALEAGRVVPSGSLADQIWPEEPPANPGNALQTLVSRLRAELRRASLDHVIESHPAGYRLVVRPDAVDALVFETLAVRGRRALADGDPREAAAVLRSALASWRGQPLADAAGHDFADATAAKLTELRSSVLTDRIEADLALGEGASLVGLEQVYLRILRGEEGVPTVAMSAARPSDHSLDTERTVVSAQVTSAHPVAPSTLTSFVGRDAEVSRVLKNLGSARLVTLTGPGGVGKTRLAAEVSVRLAGGAWFVELAPVTDPAEVAYAVLDTLGIRERVISRRTADPATGPLDRLAEALADRDDVVILDNCEHVIEAAAALAGRVLAACPRVRIMATSRQPLRIDGETLCPVPPLPIPPPPPSYAEGSESYASVRLLRDRAVAVRPDFELHTDNTAAVARICRALDGMPLAIELAAVWLRTLETVRAYGLERLAEVGEHDRVRDAFAARARRSARARRAGGHPARCGPHHPGRLRRGQPGRPRGPRGRPRRARRNRVRRRLRRRPRPGPR